MSIKWEFPKSNLKKVVVFLCNGANSEQIEDMIEGKIERDENYLEKYCKELSPDTDIVTFDKPDSQYKFDRYNIIMYGYEQDQRRRMMEYIDFNSIEWE